MRVMVSRFQTKIKLNYTSVNNVVMSTRHALDFSQANQPRQIWTKGTFKCAQR